MKGMSVLLFIFTSLLMPLHTFAADEALSIDRSINPDLHISFPNDDNIEPTSSDFIIENYVLMSNETGERWAVLTLKNEAAGNRIFTQDYVLALFADGQRKKPLKHNQRFKSKEIKSILLSFGESKFPILEIYKKP
ncbi:hypothetical protein [Litoribacillus peritrichatus]|uniref:Uncharacterized protein n=1 Tax=Litoribacillus peritrichatus TaxID=718191 RepID=A0ABP7MEZ2_9GAMM